VTTKADAYPDGCRSAGADECKDNTFRQTGFFRSSRRGVLG
jgi:hypothetical protein